MSDSLILPPRRLSSTSRPKQSRPFSARHKQPGGPRARSARGDGGFRLPFSRLAAIVNLSMSGAQLRGPARVLPDQPAVVKIGWPLDDRQCAVLARVRWVHFEPDAARDEGLYRVGMEFETWDVARLKEIMRYLKARATSDR
jgi:hypothetical protein